MADRHRFPPWPAAAGQPRQAAALAALALLCGCTTLKGAQDMPAEMRAVTLEDMGTALRNYHAPDDAARGGMGQLAYRNTMIGLYQNAVERKYRSFVDRLTSSDRGTALGFDLLQLGIGGATALAGAGAVHELATVGTVAAGARSALDKRLFFDRTLPALVAAMDAERADIKARIARRRLDPVDQYSLDQAFDDLDQLVAAGRLDRAVGRLTQAAAAEKAAAEAALAKIPAGCEEYTANSPALTRDFRLRVLGTGSVPGAAELAAQAVAADDLKYTMVAGADNGRALLKLFADAKCSDDAKRALIDRIDAAAAGGG